MARRIAIVPPAPAPYREPLFELLESRGRIAPRVIYQSGGQPGWDQPSDWFPAGHAYDAVTLRSAQRRRAGRTPVLLPRGLGQALDDFDPQAVVSWEYGAATLRSLAWCRRRRRPLVVFSELTPAVAGELSAVRRRLHPLVARRAAGFIAASSAARLRLERLGVDPAAVQVSLQSADLAAFSVTPRRDPGPVRLLAVGRLVPDKNYALLLEALGEAAIDEGVELVVVGEGPLQGELRELASRLRLPVRFRGYLPPAELPAEMASADAFVLVSLYEPFGAAVREAAAAGLPIVCSREAGAAGDVAVEEENALLVDPRSSAEIASALQRIVHDEALRERLGEGSRRVTARHPLEADAEAIESAVEQGR